MVDLVGVWKLVAHSTQVGKTSIKYLHRGVCVLGIVSACDFLHQRADPLIARTLIQTVFIVWVKRRLIGNNRWDKKARRKYRIHLKWLVITSMVTGSGTSAAEHVPGWELTWVSGTDTFTFRITRWWSSLSTNRKRTVQKYEKMDITFTSSSKDVQQMNKMHLKTCIPLVVHLPGQ